MSELRGRPIDATATISEARLAWGINALAFGYFAWNYSNLAHRTATVAPMIAGLGGSVPSSTAFVLANHSWLYPLLFMGAGFIAIGKEWLLRDKRVSVCFTFVVAMVVLWLSHYLESVLALPLLELIKQLQ